MEPTDRQKRRAERFVARAQAIRSFNASETGDLAFMGRPLVQLTLPHNDPGDVERYHRVNGDVELVVISGEVKVDEGPSQRAGIPYGVYPRLLLAWVTTEAVRTKNRTLVLGGSLTAFINELGISTGGRTAKLFRNQMIRLFNSTIQVVGGGKGWSGNYNFQVANRTLLWWDAEAEHETVGFNSAIRLSEEFFELITERPVPVDMRALQALKSSPLGLDLYMWLTYRVSYMRTETVISWKQLESQLGADYTDTKNFARSAKRELKKIQLVWPDLKIAMPRGRLVLYPSPPHVAPRMRVTSTNAET